VHFAPFYVINPIEPMPQNNHDGRSKRRRLNSSSPNNTLAIDRFIPSCSRSPIAASIPHQSAENRPSSQPSCDDDSFTDRPLTQDQSLLPKPPSPSLSAVVAAVQAATTVVGPPSLHLPPTILSFIKSLHQSFTKCLIGFYQIIHFKQSTSNTVE
jgi:hypothetical protein